MSDSFHFLHGVALFLLPAVLLWLIVTSLLGFISGWHGLMRAYPDQKEPAFFKVRIRYSAMGGVRMRRILTLSASPSGLRVHMLRVLGPFCRDFLVPWEDISVHRKSGIFEDKAELRFQGRIALGSLTIPAYDANQLARNSKGHWPEAGDFPVETHQKIRSSLLKEWLLATSLAATFFIVVPRMTMPRPDAGPPIIVAILFPAVAVGIFLLVEYWRRLKNRK